MRNHIVDEAEGCQIICRSYKAQYYQLTDFTWTHVSNLNEVNKENAKKSSVFWDITLCSPIKNRRFEKTFPPSSGLKQHKKVCLLLASSRFLA
jgi:hypothetical protein